MQSTPSAAWFVVLLAMLPGCAVRNCFTVETQGRYAATPPGRSAVLRVTCPEWGPIRTGKETWGVIETANAAGRFAEFLAHAARAQGGMDVATPYDVAGELAEAGLEPTLEPTDEQLARFAEVLGCRTYLTARVALWRYSYFLLASSAELECSVACHDAADGRVIWQAQVRRAARGTSDRELAAAAMRELFLQMRARPATAPAEPCPPLAEERAEAMP